MWITIANAGILLFCYKAIGIWTSSKDTEMKKNEEEKVSKFFNPVGWKTEGENTEDARRREDLREYAKEYVSKWRLRILSHRTVTSGRFFIKFPP
jgi:hypothetical protein